MNKLNLFLLGMQRAGSTSLFDYLSNQNRISYTSIKETNIFSDRLFYNQNHNKHSSFKITLNNLLNFTEKKINSKYFLEGSVNHFYSIGAPKKIYKYNTDSLFIILYREPISRMYSHYLMDRMNNLHSYSFNEAVHRELIKGEIIGSDLGYLEMSLFKKYINIWFQYFKKSNFLFLEYNKLNDFNYFKSSLEEFLNIPIQGSIENKNKSFELKNNFFLKNLYFLKKLPTKYFLNDYLKKFIKNLVYKEPDILNLDDFLYEKLKNFFNTDINFYKKLNSK